MPVDVAAGVPAVRGDAVVEGEDWGREVLKVREREQAEGRRAREARRQRAQIMLGCGGWRVELRKSCGLHVERFGGLGNFLVVYGRRERASAKPISN
jgi:hypothetical protein